MARHRDLQKDSQREDILSEDELQQMREGLSHLSLEAVRHAYQTAYARCRMVNDRVPAARYRNWCRRGNNCGSGKSDKSGVALEVPLCSASILPP